MPTAATIASDQQVPLCVDLDGTIIKTDLLWESFVRLLCLNPLYLLVMPFWWMRGRAFLKKQLALRVRLDVATLPYNEPFVEFVRQARRDGRRIILATASDRGMAEPVARHLGIFDEVMASEGKVNLRGAAKREALAARFGERGYDYAGDSSVDLAVWPGAREALIIRARPEVAQKAARLAPANRTFGTATPKLAACLRSLRPHQWIKNLIIFVPVVTAHAVANATVLANAAWAFFAFCLCASSVYICNDLVDLESDRHHPAKRLRPFASGDLPLPYGLMLAPVLLVASFAVSWKLSPAFVGVVGGYFLASTSYSLRLKQVALLDVFWLAGLFTVRLIAGHIATGLAWSVWLLVFSMFIFLSLALLKRFLALQAIRQQNQQELKGHGYTADDLELVTTIGLVSGYLAVLVLALYVNSSQVVTLYRHPTLLLLVCPLLLYWVSRVWLLAHRGQMEDDPTAFAFKDPVSYLVGVLTLLVMWLATTF